MPYLCSGTSVPMLKIEKKTCIIQTVWLRWNVNKGWSIPVTYTNWSAILWLVHFLLFLLPCLRASYMYLSCFTYPTMSVGFGRLQKIFIILLKHWVWVVQWWVLFFCFIWHWKMCIQWASEFEFHYIKYAGIFVKYFVICFWSYTEGCEDGRNEWGKIRCK